MSLFDDMMQEQSELEAENNLLKKELEGEDQDTAQKKTHTMRTNKNRRVTVLLNRKMAIKAKCTECMGWEGNPNECTAILCPLYPFRGRTMLTRDKKDANA